MDSLKLGGIFKVKCFDKDGDLKWEDEAHNLVTTEGLNYILNAGFRGAAADSTWFVGLKLTGNVVAGDTLASHTSWTEFTDYTGTRQAYTTNGDSTVGSLSNSVSPASFPITGSGTLTGAFIAGVTSGTSGTLFSGAEFTGGSRAVVNGDTVNVTYTLSAADDGV